jgi:hypothetical protein
MVRIAESINIKTEVKTDYVINDYGYPTEETYEYREYDVLDVDNNTLETGRYTEETITLEEILERTGIQFGLSKWITLG